MAMKSIYTVSIFIIFALSLSVVPCFAGDFFYLVLQWPGSYCGAKHGCCFPKTGKPANDFAIAGLRPCYLNAKIPQFCNSQPFQYPKTSNLTKSLQRNWPSLACPSSDSKKLWSHEWKKYGTCSRLNQHAYFEAALRLKSQVNLLKILKNAGIQANGRFYDVGTGVEEAIRMGVGYMPGLWCNEDKTGNSQLYQVVMCGDVKGTRIIDCPGIPMGSVVNRSSFLLSKFN